MNDRSPNTPSMRLTTRDIRLIHSVNRYRVLRRDQVQRLLFLSKNTANQRLKLLHQHGYLARRRLPVEYGQGSAQALYMLATRGASLMAEKQGLDLAEIGWRRSHNHVSSPFLEHTLMINDVRLAVELARREQHWAIETWLREEAQRQNALQQLRALRDRVRECNPDLDEEAAVSLADRLSREVIAEMADENKIRYQDE